MTSTTESAVTTQVYRVYIKATPQAIWDVLVSGGLADEGAGGGWSWVLSDLKTLLETGERLPWQ
jgi:hypothetical protein